MVERSTLLSRILPHAVLVIGVLGFVVNGVCFLLLREGSSEHLTLKSAYLDVLADILGPVAGTAGVGCGGAPSHNEERWPREGETLGQYRLRNGLPGTNTGAALAIKWIGGTWSDGRG